MHGGLRPPLTKANRPSAKHTNDDRHQQHTFSFLRLSIQSPQSKPHARLSHCGSQIGFAIIDGLHCELQCAMGRLYKIYSQFIQRNRIIRWIADLQSCLFVEEIFLSDCSTQEEVVVKIQKVLG